MVIGIAIVILTLGVGALFLLVCRLTVDALPAFAGCAAGFWAYDTGAGPIGALAIGVVGAAITPGAGRLAFDCSRSAATRTCIAFVFAAPAAYVGYHVILALAQYAVPSDVWRHAFALIGAFLIGVSATTRIAGSAGLSSKSALAKAGRASVPRPAANHTSDRWLHAGVFRR
jgi:hypothetical protein